MPDHTAEAEANIAAAADANKAIQAVIDAATPLLQKFATRHGENPAMSPEPVGFLIFDLETPESRALAVEEVGAQACDQISNHRAIASVARHDYLHAFYLARGGSDSAWMRGFEGAHARGVSTNSWLAVVVTGNALAITWLLFANMTKGGSA